MKKTRHILGMGAVLALFLLASLTASGANYYWVGGSGSWSDYSNHWATTSGGATFRTQVPTANDDVFFDANSFTATGQTVNGDNTIIFFRNMDWTGATYSPTFLQSTTSSTINVFGSLTLISAMTWSVSGSVIFLSNTTGNTITSAGKTYKNRVDFDGSGGAWVLQDAMTLDGSASGTNSGMITLNFGTLNTNAMAVNCLGFTSSNSNVRSLIMDNSTFTITNNSGSFGVWNTSNVSNFTLSAAGSTITIAGTYQYPNFSSNSKTYNNLYFTYTSGLQQNISGSGNTFNGTVTFSGISTGTGNNTFNGALNFSNTGTLNGSTCNGTTTFSGDGTLNGSNTINGTLNLTAGKTYLFQSNATQTISATGTLNATGTCTQPIALRSTTNGIQATINKVNGNLNVDQTIMQDMKATLSATYTANATNSFDAGNNTNWIFPTFSGPAMYWVGGSGNWNDPTHWSFTSGGAAGSCIPGPGNDVFFDANSFTSTSKTVTMNSSTGSCKSMTWTGAAHTPTFASSNTANTLKIYGSVTLISAMSFSYNGSVSFESKATGNTITSAGKNWPMAGSGSGPQIYFNGVGGSWTLQDAFTTSNIISLVNGTLTTNNQAVTCFYFESQYSNVRTLNLGSSTWTCTGYYWLVNSGTNLTLNAGTSTIRLTYCCFDYFYGGNKTYYNVSFEGTNGTNSIQNSNTFDGTVTFIGDGDIGSNNTYNGNLVFSPGRSYNLNQGTTQTITATGSLTANGTCGNYIMISTQTTGNQATITKVNGNLTVDNTVLKDIRATLSTGYQANATNNSTDLGNNTNWNFGTYTGTNLYWVGGAGNWNDPNHWSLTSGGTPGGCVPGAKDNVNFDANSFTNTSKTVTINTTNAYCKNMNWTGAGFTPTLTYNISGKLRIHGSLTLISAMNFNYSGQINFESTSAGNTITTAGKTINATVYFTGGTGAVWSLQDGFTTSNFMELTSGTLNTNNQPVSCLYFGSYSGVSRALNLGSSTFTIQYYYWNVSSSNFSFNAGTSTIRFLNQYPGAGSIYPLYASGLTYYNVTFESGVNPGTIQGPGTFNGVVTFNGNGQIEGTSTFNGNVVFLSDGKINSSNTYNASLKFTSGKSYILASGATQTFGTAGTISFIAIGSPCAPIAISSSVNGSVTNLTKASGEVCADYLYLNSVKALGGATWSAGLNSTNTTPTTGDGWVYTACSSPLQSSVITASGPLCGSGSITLSSRTASSYSWSTGATTQSIVVATAGTYSITIVNLNGCVESGSLTVVSSAVPTCSISGATSTCPSANETYTGPSGMAGYAWSISGPGSIPGSAIGSSVGIVPTSCGAYTVSVTVANTAGCTSTCNTITGVVDNTNPVIACPSNITTTHATGLCGKNVTFSVTGTDNCGIPSIVSTPASGSFFAVGTTTVNSVAIDACGNTSSCSFTVTVTTNPLSVSATNTNLSCNGGNNGTITTTVTGGSGTYSYSWTGGATGANPTGLAAGTYTVTVSDGGCSTPVNAVVTITQPAAISLTATSTQPTCSNNTGSVSLTSSGGTGTISYNSTATTGLTTGTYTYISTDANGCTATQTVTITNPSAITFTATATQPTCSSNTGSVSLSTPTGGTGTISYNSTATTGLTTGSYTYIATDANSCTASQTVTITNPSAITFSATTTQPTCSGNTGSVTLVSSGGTGAITYSGDATTGLTTGTYNYTATDANGCTATTSATIANPSAITFTATATQPTCSYNTGSVTLASSGGTGAITYSGDATTALAAGTYSYTATDANGCTATASATITNPSAIAFAATATQPTCSYNTGSVTLASSGGTGAITYSGDATTGLTTGTYSYTATDANGCTATASATITNPSAITFSATATQPTCSYNTGSVTLASSGGTGAITYSGDATTGLTTDTYSYTATDANGCTATASATITNPSAITFTATATQPTCSYNAGSVTLASSGGTGTIAYTGDATTGLTTGAYSYTATDASGCTAAASATIANPSSITFTATATQPTCSYNTGSVTLASSGGTGTIAYTGDATTGLTTGAYSYTATDANGCTATASATIASPSEITFTAIATQPTCSYNTGIVTLASSGGTGVITYSGDATTGLTTGTYSYTATDANGCTATASATITNPSAITFTATAMQPTCSYNTGSVTLVSSGGTGAITYSGDATTGLTTGTYSYTATDVNGCTATASATITNPSVITFTATATQPTCSYNTGSVTLASSGGTGTITYSGDATTGLTTGTYNYTATDANGCTAAASAAISNPSAITYSSVSATNISCNNSNGGVHNNGTATVNGATGGTGTLGYVWSNGATTNPATSLTGPTAYSVTITDANGCTTNGSAAVGQPTVITASSTATSVSCNTANGGSHSNGSIASSIGGGTGSYTYAWSNGQTGATNTGLPIGTYTLTVTDANSCTAVTSATVGQPSSFTCSISITPANTTFTGGIPNNIYLGYGPQSATVTASVSIGSGYTYSWSPSTRLSSSTIANPVFTPTASGTYTYTVTATNSYGCNTTCTVSFCVVDAVDHGAKGGSKVILCHIPPGNPGNPQQLSISASAVDAHLTGHTGDHLGPCYGGCGTGAKSENGAMIAEHSHEIRVYPNPTDGVINVEIPDIHKTANIIIMDVTGRVVDQRNIAENTGEAIQFNLGGVAKGIYLIKISAGDEPNVTRVIVK